MQAGPVAQYLGDGALVYFGYPLAHEDDAERAVRAAARSVESRFEALHPGALIPLIGREAEMDMLLRYWNEAK